jgi:hypothetical protein
LDFAKLVAKIAWVRRPGKRILDTIEYNLEQLNELDFDEL